jgi:AcrR family transcriptional regulator
MSSVDGRSRPAASALTREKVIEEARALIQEAGVESLTLRKLAARCGVGTMTLYRHMRTKEELLQAVANTYFAEIDLPTVPGEAGGPPWHERVADLFREVRRICMKYPELAAIGAAQPVDGIDSFRGADVVLGCLAEGGITGARAIAAFDALGLYTMGFALREAKDWSSPEARAQRAARMLALPEEFPHLAEMGLALMNRSASEHFEEGLQLILDGLRHEAEVPPRLVS